MTDPDGIGRVRGFFLWCAGARPVVMVDCPNDVNAYVTQGVAVCLTSFVAVCAWAYALHIYLEASFTAAILAACLLGAVVFNIDRSIITSGDRRFWAYCVRMLIATLFGLATSIPVELLAFRHQIDRQMIVDKQKTVDLRRREVDQQFSGELRDLEARKATIRVQSQQAWADYKKAADVEIAETNGLLIPGVTTGKPSYGPAAKTRAEEKAKAEGEWRRAQLEEQTEKGEVDKRVNEIHNEQNASLSEIGSAAGNDDGIPARLRALYKYSEGEPLTIGFDLIIILFFLLIDILPVLIKIQRNLKPGLYESTIAAEDEVKKILKDEAVAECLLRRLQTEQLIKIAEESHYRDPELMRIPIRESQKKILEKMILSREEIIGKIVDKWQETVIDDIESDPSKYIR